MPSIHVSKIAVLQSLPAGEAQTGLRLHEDIETINVFHRRGLDVDFLDVPSTPQFLAALDKLRQEAEAEVCPILHIECHGTDDQTGIVLADGSSLEWRQLKPYLTAINVSTRCNLLIVMACCNGGYLAQTLLPTDRAPCWALLGPTSTVFVRELLAFLPEFYRTFLETLSGDKSVAALTGAKLQTGRFAFMPAGGFFRISFAKYLAEHCTPEELRRRGEQLAQKLIEMGSPQVPTPSQITAILLKTEPDYFEKYLRQFFMMDLYPDNADRFPITYEDVKALAETFRKPKV